jgi:hypothetical protein
VADAGVALELERPVARARARSHPLLDVLEQRLDLVAVGIVLVPLVVGAIALVVGVGGSYASTSDIAMEELATRDIGRHWVLVGLHSRSTWNHPGPLLNYLLAPFYWVTGGRSIGLHVGALALNGAAIVGMAVVARRHGGRALLLCTLVGTVLVMRTAGADFLNDPWVCFVTTLPFGLLIMLSWSLACGERRALPWAVLVTSFVAQTHVGFVALAPPLMLWGAGWLLVPGWRSGDAGVRRDLRRTVLASSALAVVLWSPLLLDSWFNSPSNSGNVWRWFDDGEKEFGMGAHDLADGWHVVTGQFDLPPEWLTTKLDVVWPFAEVALLYEHGVPWLLLPVALAAAVAWRRLRRSAVPLVPAAVPAGTSDGRPQTATSNGDGPGVAEAHVAGDSEVPGDGDRAGRNARDAIWLAATLALALVVGIVAVARTVGPVFDYRMRWTWVIAMLAGAFTLWVGWVGLRARQPAVERRLLVPLALAVLLVVSGINVVTGATAGTPYEGDSDIAVSLTEQVAEVVDPDGGVVVIEAPFHAGLWWSRALVLHLERRGVDVRVVGYQGIQHEFGHELRRYDEAEPLQMWLHVVRDPWVADFEDNPDARLVARWTAGEPTGVMLAREVAVFRDLAKDRQDYQQAIDPP